MNSFSSSLSENDGAFFLHPLRSKTPSSQPSSLSPSCQNEIHNKELNAKKWLNEAYQPENDSSIRSYKSWLEVLQLLLRGVIMLESEENCIYILVWLELSKSHRVVVCTKDEEVSMGEATLLMTFMHSKL
ncbi:unnamed protein product [Vicia faba]|uniref:Uncharacterized protein n=1 Tax=Vicia faba TaxID=3906 RepID=A0AAV1BAJ0_VICFA|nr:unnamed protein product [Vicia faba]